LNLPDDQLADMAVAGMLPAVREKLFGMEFDNLGQLSQKLSLMSNQAYGFKKGTRFNKQHDMADIYNKFLEKVDQMEDSDDDQEIAAAEIMWGKEPLTMNQRWIKQTKGTYDFDVTKADKLFEFLVKEGRIKLPIRSPLSSRHPILKRHPKKSPKNHPLQLQAMLSQANKRRC
jgi:hypothetical protein